MIKSGLMEMDNIGHFYFIQIKTHTGTRHIIDHSCKNHHMSRALDVETCREGKINANLLSIFQLLPAEVRETERTTLSLTLLWFKRKACPLKVMVYF